MTPANNGAGAPEDDDPFGYLYADGQARGAQPPSSGYGYPNAVGRARPVGERQYGAPQQTAQYGAPPQQQYGAPQQGYGVPQQQGAYGPPPTQQPPSRSAGRGGGGRGPNTKGLLIGAVAVVAAVVVGIAIAMSSNSSDDSAKGNTASSSSEPSAEASASPSESSTSEATTAELPKIDAKSLKLEGGAQTSSEFKGAEADGGIYVGNFNNVGAKATWTVNGIAKDGTYRLYVRYGIPGVDADSTIIVNGEASSRPLSMKNFGGGNEGDWEKGWKTTWANVNLTKGTNVIAIACGEGNQCNFVLDQLYLKND